MSWLWVCGATRKEKGEYDEDGETDGSGFTTRTRTTREFEAAQNTDWEYMSTSGFSVDNIQLCVRRTGGFPMPYRSQIWQRVVDQALEDARKTNGDSDKWSEDTFEKLYRVVTKDVSAENMCLLNIFKKYIEVDDQEGSNAAHRFIEKEQAKGIHNDVVFVAIVQIKNDLLRTQGGSQIRNDKLVSVLLMFVLYDALTSYVQGMDAICLILTTHLSERYSFWAFVCICNICLKDYFTENMLGSNVELMVFSELLKEKNLLVWKHFAHIGRGLHLVPNVEDLTEISCVDLARTVLMTFTLEWFLKVFAGCVPDDPCLHIYDNFFSYMCSGVDARKLSHAICLAIFKMLEKEFLSLTLDNTGDVLDPSEIMSETKYKLKVFLGEPSDRIIGKLTSPEVSCRFMEYVFTYLDQFDEEALAKMENLREQYANEEMKIIEKRKQSRMK